MKVKVWQRHDDGFLINGDWGIPKGTPTEEEAKSKDLVLFEDKWVTKEEK